MWHDRIHRQSHLPSEGGTEAVRGVLRAVRLGGEQPLPGARRTLLSFLIQAGGGIYKCMARNASAVAVK